MKGAGGILVLSCAQPRTSSIAATCILSLLLSILEFPPGFSEWRSFGTPWAQHSVPFGPHGICLQILIVLCIHDILQQCCEPKLWMLRRKLSGRLAGFDSMVFLLSSTWSCFLELVSNDCGLQYDLSGSQPLSAFSEHHHDSKACCTWLRVIMCALWASVAWCLEEKTESYWICFMFVVILWPPDNMLLLQKAVHASTALDGPAGRTCHCSEIYCIDLQSIYRLNVLPSCSGPGDGSLLVPPSLSNVSRPGPSDILLCCTLLYFLCYLLRPMAIKSIQLQAPHSMIQYIRYISLLPYWSYCLCGLSC